MLAGLFNVSSNEMVSLLLLRQRVQPQIPTEEIIAVLKELDDDAYIMYRDEAAHREEEEDQLHAGGMRLDHTDQGVPLPGLYLLVVEEFVGRMRLCSGRPAACQKALDW